MATVSSSDTDTETEAPLSPLSHLYMKNICPNLSDEINGVEMGGFSSNKRFKMEPGTETQGEINNGVIGVMYQDKFVSSTTTTNTHSNSIIQQDITITDGHQGRYGFRIEWGKNEKIPAKSCNYTYSSILEKLFTQKDKLVPLKFTSDVQLPAGEAEIRSYLAFKDINCRDNIVVRCPHHINDPFQDEQSKYHVMDSPQGEHLCCPGSGRYITVFKPRVTHGQHDLQSFVASVRFRCSSTCRGGIDRRQVVALFELYIKKHYEGHALIEVCICSSPGRDRTNCEDKVNKKNTPSVPDGVVDTPLSDTGQKRSNPYPSEETKRERLYSLSNDQDEEYYYVKVKGAENAALLARLAEKLTKCHEK